MTTPKVTDADRKRAEAGVDHIDYSSKLGHVEEVEFWATEFARDRERLEIAIANGVSLIDQLTAAGRRIERLEAEFGVESGLLVDAKQRIEELEVVAHDNGKSACMRDERCDHDYGPDCAIWRRTEAALASKEQG